MNIGRPGKSCNKSKVIKQLLKDFHFYRDKQNNLFLSQDLPARQKKLHMFIIIQHKEFVHIFTTVIICHKQEYQKRQYIDDYSFCWQNTKLGNNECFLSTLLLPHNWVSYPIIISSAKEKIYIVAKIIWLICRKDLWYLCIFTR